MSTPLALHSKASPNWGTPTDHIELARAVMGGIDLDPCTSQDFNARVRAGRIFTATENALQRSWAPPVLRLLTPLDGSEMPVYLPEGHGRRVFINPPGGLVPEFWRKLHEEIASGNVEQAVWVGFSVEQLCLLAKEEFHPMDFSTCIVRKRISFEREDGYKGSPSHGNYITGLGVDHARFEALYTPVGKVTRGVLAI